MERWLKRVLESSEDRADQSCLEEEEEEPKHIFKTYEFGGEDGAGGGGGRRSVVLLEEGRDPMGGGEEGTTGLVGKNNYLSHHGISPLLSCGESRQVLERLELLLLGLK